MSHQVIYINSYDFGQFTAWSHLSDWFSVCCCSSLPEWDSERRGWMCVDSLSHSDRQSRWSRWRRRCCSDSSSAAGAVGSVHCTADSSAGEEAQSLVSFFKPLSPNKRHVFSPVSLQAYQLNLETRPEDTSVSGLSYTRLFLSSFSQVMNSWRLMCFYFPHTLTHTAVFIRVLFDCFPQMNCDSDPHHESMPLQPSFLITVFCAGSDLCPSDLQCPQNTRTHSLQKCWRDFSYSVSFTQYCHLCGAVGKSAERRGRLTSVGVMKVYAAAVKPQRHWCTSVSVAFGCSVSCLLLDKYIYIKKTIFFYTVVGVLQKMLENQNLKNSLQRNVVENIFCKVFRFPPLIPTTQTKEMK